MTRLALDPRAADVMVTYLVALGLLERTEDGRIAPTRLAAALDGVPARRGRPVGRAGPEAGLVV